MLHSASGQWRKKRNAMERKKKKCKTCAALSVQPVERDDSRRDDGRVDQKGCRDTCIHAEMRAHACARGLAHSDEAPARSRHGSLGLAHQLRCPSNRSLNDSVQYTHALHYANATALMRKTNAQDECAGAAAKTYRPRLCERARRGAPAWKRPPSRMLGLRTTRQQSAGAQRCCCCSARWPLRMPAENALSRSSLARHTARSRRYRCQRSAWPRSGVHCPFAST